MTKTYNIRPLSYTNFTNREFESLMIDTSQVLEDFTKSHKDETMYGKHLDSFKSKLSDYQAQLASVEKKESTSLTTVDKERDSALVGLFTLHRGFAKIKESSLKEAYETLKAVFTKYKDITKHSNDVETAEIKSMLKTLSETPYHEAVTSLGLTPMLTAVVNAQEEYDQVESKARASKSVKEVGKTKQVRTELTSIYNLFMRYTAASAEAYPEKEHLTQLLKELNSIRDSKRRLITSSKKDKKTKPAELAQAAG
ncbi:DUF6261 family protein [Streptococcus sp. SO4]|uniref:DUF6261 family protein n=1 Tax=Streptococcus sp. SO4 TaxID=3018249 RepID=UPI00263C6992|nr:DUF6261 family protein [Streptococcus sp. SO4]MDN5023972.1 DUF6261 family protein [Streptococcus sp. SO4]